MNITDPSPDDITLQQAAILADCNAKTIRRAIQQGHLARRYVMSARGPQLVFLPADVERWIVSRASSPRPGQQAEAAPPTVAWAALVDRIAALEALLTEQQAMNASLERRLTAIEAQGAGPSRSARRHRSRDVG